MSLIRMRLRSNRERISAPEEEEEEEGDDRPWEDQGGSGTRLITLTTPPLVDRPSSCRPSRRKTRSASTASTARGPSARTRTRVQLRPRNRDWCSAMRRARNNSNARTRCVLSFFLLALRFRP